MEKRELCITCVSDKSCSFTRKSPVLNCEEFSCFSSAQKQPRKNIKVSVKAKA